MALGFFVTKLSQFGFGEMARLCLYLASAKGSRGRNVN